MQQGVINFLHSLILEAYMALHQECNHQDLTSQTSMDQESQAQVYTDSSFACKM